MSDRPPMSRLPVDPAYWERLAARSVTAALAAGSPAALPQSVSWWHWLSAAGFRLAAGAAVVTLAGTLLRSERTPPPADASGPLAALVIPEDRLLRTVLESGEVTSDHELLLRLVALRAEER